MRHEPGRVAKRRYYNIKHWVNHKEHKKEHEQDIKIIKDPFWKRDADSTSRFCCIHIITLPQRIVSEFFAQLVGYYQYAEIDYRIKKPDCRAETKVKLL